MLLRFRPKYLRPLVLYIAWFQATLATLGSLYHSEYLKLPPCVLCWYQRIAIYPLVAILAVGLLKDDRDTTAYAWPFALVGWLLAFYHNLLYYNVVGQNGFSCEHGVSCTQRQIEYFGFLTLPLLSLLAFSIIIALLVIHDRLKPNPSD